MLRRLLNHLARQNTMDLFKVSIVVVDNDSEGSARDTVMSVQSKLGLQCVYSVEPERTIPAARNHGLRLAAGNYIAIIDDDEFPPADWLVTLYRAIITFEVDGALGPVHPYFEQTPPRWLIRSRFCERPVHRTGTLLHWTQTRTGNVLLKREVFDKHNLQFDESMKTGGTDREFFKHAMRFGCRFVAVEEAPVYEIVPPERWKKSYYVKRALVNGFNAHRNSRAEGGLKRAITPVKSIAASLAYAAAAPFTVVLGTHALMSCLVRGGHHFSRVCATLGVELVKKRDF
jgi:succinoglycan biosynthesis protein ExoM